MWQDFRSFFEEVDKYKYINNFFRLNTYAFFKSEFQTPGDSTSKYFFRAGVPNPPAAAGFLSTSLLGTEPHSRR